MTSSKATKAKDRTSKSVTTGMSQYSNDRVSMSTAGDTRLLQSTAGGAGGTFMGRIVVVNVFGLIMPFTTLTAPSLAATEASLRPSSASLVPCSSSCPAFEAACCVAFSISPTTFSPSAARCCTAPSAEPTECSTQPAAPDKSQRLRSPRSRLEFELEFVVLAGCSMGNTCCTRAGKEDNSRAASSPSSSSVAAIMTTLAQGLRTEAKMTP
mmetsp:Transcript_72684/g.173521  ORF Transcript_72684/g.173521 Transcript_72684/m.173521 type:complete len:211 (+) Transcript_72684:857-1489(+)